MKKGLAVAVALILLFSAIAYLANSREKQGTPQFPSAEMVLDRSVYSVGDSLTLTIINDGNEPLLVGAFYRLYRFENGKWKSISTGITVTGIGYQIGPGQNWSQTIPLMVARNGKLEPLPPGRYRIEKTVIIDRGRCGRGSDEITLSAEFEVVG